MKYNIEEKACFDLIDAINSVFPNFKMQHLLQGSA